ncbi:hypothetical protein GCM10010182_65910 [Actinomadura cremea]|nr:hypothetical protein GCM10010182_65910 [Actinomadura cremea]
MSPGVPRSREWPRERFDSGGEGGVLGVDTRADTVEEPAEPLRAGGVEPAAWYGVRLSRVFHLVGRSRAD